MRYRYIEAPANESVSTVIEGIEEFDSDRVQVGTKAGGARRQQRMGREKCAKGPSFRFGEA